MTSTTLPLRWTVHVRRWSNSAIEDDHGNITEGLGPPEPWTVHAIAPGAMAEPSLLSEPTRDASHVLWTVYGPEDGSEPRSERDTITIGGTEYPINGLPKPFTQGPWEFEDAGVVVELRRVEG